MSAPWCVAIPVQTKALSAERRCVGVSRRMLGGDRRIVRSAKLDETYWGIDE